MAGFSFARNLNLFPPAMPVASQCLPAVGAAWGIKLADQQRAVICTLGDASTRQGEFYEAVCFAVEKRLPVVFVIEDNGYGISTPTVDQLPFRLNIFDDRLLIKVNGRDVHELWDQSGRAISQARKGKGPVILWCGFDRLASHTSSDDHRKYRSREELETIDRRDPIVVLANQLMQAGDMTTQEWQSMQEAARELNDSAYRQAECRPAPISSTVLDHLYSERSPRYSPVLPEPAGDCDTMVGALNHTLRAALTQDANVILFGEDVEDPKGGVFGFTRGLSTAFPGRVVNSPLAEATIIGAAVGLAATGYRPVCEIQFIDFLTPGFNQLVQQVATLRWRSKGHWVCPMVLYAPCGAIPSGWRIVSQPEQ